MKRARKKKEKKSIKIYWEGVIKTINSIWMIYSVIIPAIVVVGLPVYLTTKDLLLSLTLFNTAVIIILPLSIFKAILFILPEPSTFKGSEYPGYINPRCRKLKIKNTEEKEDVVYVYVKCEAGYFHKSGCPYNCPGFSTASGVGTLAGGLIGGLIGLAGGPFGVLAGFILGGIGGTILESASMTKYEQKATGVRSVGKRIVIVPSIC